MDNKIVNEESLSQNDYELITNLERVPFIRMNCLLKQMKIPDDLIDITQLEESVLNGLLAKIDLYIVIRSKQYFTMGHYDEAWIIGYLGLKDQIRLELENRKTQNTEGEGIGNGSQI